MAERHTSSTEQLLKVCDIARILNISLPMAYRLVQRGNLVAVRIGRTIRIVREDLEDYIGRSRGFVAVEKMPPPLAGASSGHPRTWKADD